MSLRWIASSNGSKVSNRSATWSATSVAFARTCSASSFLRGSDSSGPEPLTVDLQPLFERRIIQTESFKEIALKEPDRFVERVGSVPGGEFLEAGDVDYDPGRIQTDAIAFAANRLDTGLGERMAEV